MGVLGSISGFLSAVPGQAAQSGDRAGRKPGRAVHLQSWRAAVVAQLRPPEQAGLGIRAAVCDRQAFGTRHRSSPDRVPADPGRIGGQAVRQPPAASRQPPAASRQRFFTLADVLGRHGYDTGFYYGGESHFDNMREFFLANGFTRIVDRKDYRKPAFVGSWGASGEDLFGRADQQFRHMHWASSSARRWPHRTGTTPCSWWWLTMIRGCSAGTWCRSATSIFPG